MNQTYFRVKNFEKLQPKRNGKNAPWIRLYANWMMDSAVSQLGDTAKAHWIGIISVAHTESNRIPYDPVWIKRRCIFNSPVKLDVFIKLGLIEILDNKSVSVSEPKMPIGSIGRVEEKRVVIQDENINVPDEWKNETLVQHYRKEFKRVFGEFPDMNYSRDGAILKGLAKDRGVAKVKQWLTTFMDSDDQFCGATGRSILVFKSQINKLITGTLKDMKGSTPNSHGGVRV
jgi:hypothetical protein